MSTAHIFYLPVFILIGGFAGYFIGRWRAEVDLAESRKAQQRRDALRKSKTKNTPD